MALLHLFTTILLLSQVVYTGFSLEIHFYRNSCPMAEFIVKRTLKEHALQDPSVPAALLRLHFHDCMVHGCDGSVLIDSTDENIAEKEAPPNLTLRGFEVIDDIKAKLEKECKGVVSCADILALATRDGVALSGGAAYALPTGRRDGTVSKMVDVQIPSPSLSVPAALAALQKIGLDLADMTTLLGAHSLGVCHCGFFMDRLYDFNGTGFPDPTMDPETLKALQKQCPPHVVTLQNITSDPTVFMTQNSSTAPFSLDNSFYRGVLAGKAVLKLDQELAFTDLTSMLALEYVNRPKFFKRHFSKAMIKLGNVGVLTGEEGEIRRDCRRVNDDASSGKIN